MRKLSVIAGSVLAGISLVGPLQGVADAQTGKLVVIVLENEPYANIVGSSQAPYLNQLIAHGELFTNYAGVSQGTRSFHWYPLFDEQISITSTFGVPSQDPQVQLRPGTRRLPARTSSVLRPYGRPDFPRTRRR